MAPRWAKRVNVSPKSKPSTSVKPWAIRWPLFLTTSPSSPCLFLKTHLVPMTLTSLGGSTMVQTWFLSKFSNSSCMALTQLKSERACPTSRGLNKATKRVLVKQERWADLNDCVTLSFKLPMICWGGCSFWTWEGVPYSEMIFPSTCDVLTAAVEEVVPWGASASSVEAGTNLGDDIDGCCASSSSPSKPYSSSSIKMLSSISLSHAHSKTSHGQGAVLLKVTSHDSTTMLVSRLNTQ
jgi:hypothetical protein